jgi:hypothetical protein
MLFLTQQKIPAEMSRFQCKEYCYRNWRTEHWSNCWAEFLTHLQKLMISRDGHSKECIGTLVTMSRIMSRREGHQFQIFQRWKVVLINTVSSTFSTPWYVLCHNLGATSCHQGRCNPNGILQHPPARCHSYILVDTFFWEWTWVSFLCLKFGMN